MSNTEIYVVGKNHCELIGSTKNAWRGAAYVWDHISKKYFGLDHFPILENDLQRRIWNANDEHDLEDFESIVLSSTMDYVVVMPQHIPPLLEAFRKYAVEHPDSSIGEQGDIIEKVTLQEGQMIAWCQTTICDFIFAPEFDEENPETPIYNNLGMAWSLFEQEEEPK